jgi:hypothetical protein
MEKVAKNRKFYTCSDCDYNTCNKYDYEKHVKTIKHKNAILSTKSGDLATFLSQKSQKIAFLCECGKTYKDKSGLWRHRKSCQNPEKHNDFESNTINNTNQAQIFADIIKTTFVELMKSGITNTNIQTHNNSHNKTFNLNFYLNETCKDAINIGDFVKSIKVQLEDLENTGRQGYVEGVSNIILHNLNSIDTHQRPIHCTDEKREILYIKNEGEWIKETENKPILTNAIKTIANENIKQISEWTKIHPDCTDAESKKNNLYLKIVSNSMSGSSKEECDKNYNKIIKNIVKETIIDKDNTLFV